jgi:hypothetical protein
MKPIRFDAANDLAPMPFDETTCRLAAELKKLGLDWRPHVGCFVWDPDACIEAQSPFPGRIYFILSLLRFIDIFGSLDNMVAKLVWLPTWHQARMLCRRLGVSDESDFPQSLPESTPLPCEDLHKLYQRIGDTLKKGL